MSESGTLTPKDTSRIKLEDVPRFEAVFSGIKRAYRDVENGRYRLRGLTLVAVLAFAGCRLGEALKLRVCDLDLRSRTVKIMQEKKEYSHPRLVPVPACCSGR